MLFNQEIFHEQKEIVAFKKFLNLLEKMQDKVLSQNR